MRAVRKLIACFLVGVCAVATSFAQPRQFEDIAKPLVTVDPPKAKRGELVTWTLTIQLEPGWHTYPTIQEGDPNTSFVTKLRFPDFGPIVFVGSLQEPKGEKKLQDLGEPVVLEEINTIA